MTTRELASRLADARSDPDDVLALRPLLTPTGSQAVSFVAMYDGYERCRVAPEATDMFVEERIRSMLTRRYSDYVVAPAEKRDCSVFDRRPRSCRGITCRSPTAASCWQTAGNRDSRTAWTRRSHWVSAISLQSSACQQSMSSGSTGGCLPICTRMNSLEMAIQLGLVEHEPTRTARRELLEETLLHHDAGVRDAATLGLDAIDDPASVPALGRALQSECVPSIKRMIEAMVRGHGAPTC